MRRAVRAEVAVDRLAGVAVVGVGFWAAFGDFQGGGGHDLVQGVGPAALRREVSLGEEGRWRGERGRGGERGAGGK